MTAYCSQLAAPSTPQAHLSYGSESPAAPHLPLGYMQAHDKMSELRGWTQPVLYCKPFLKSISYPFQQELTPTPQKHSLKQTERQLNPHIPFIIMTKLNAD